MVMPCCWCCPAAAPARCLVLPPPSSALPHSAQCHPRASGPPATPVCVLFFCEARTAHMQHTVRQSGSRRSSIHDDRGAPCSLLQLPPLSPTVILPIEPHVHLILATTVPCTCVLTDQPPSSDVSVASSCCSSCDSRSSSFCVSWTCRCGVHVGAHVLGGVAHIEPWLWLDVLCVLQCNSIAVCGCEARRSAMGNTVCSHSHSPTQETSSSPQDTTSRDTSHLLDLLVEVVHQQTSTRSSGG